MVPVMETTEEVPGNTENEFVFNAAPVEPTIRQPPAGVFDPSNQTAGPIYVNAKQYNRILKRRQARAKLAAKLNEQRAKQARSTTYIYESRHNHAVRRARRTGGKFAANPDDENATSTNEQEEQDLYENEEDHQ